MDFQGLQQTLRSRKRRKKKKNRRSNVMFVRKGMMQQFLFNFMIFLLGFWEKRKEGVGVLVVSGF